MSKLVRRFVREDQGQDLVEYAMLLALIALVVVGGRHGVRHRNKRLVHDSRGQSPWWWQLALGGWGSPTRPALLDQPILSCYDIDPGKAARHSGKVRLGPRPKRPGSRRIRPAGGAARHPGGGGGSRDSNRDQHRVFRVEYRHPGPLAAPKSRCGLLRFRCPWPFRSRPSLRSSWRCSPPSST